MIFISNSLAPLFWHTRGKASQSHPVPKPEPPPLPLSLNSLSRVTLLPRSWNSLDELVSWRCLWLVRSDDFEAAEQEQWTDGIGFGRQDRGSVAAIRALPRLGPFALAVSSPRPLVTAPSTAMIATPIFPSDSRFPMARNLSSFFFT